MRWLGSKINMPTPSQNPAGRSHIAGFRVNSAYREDRVGDSGVTWSEQF